MNLRCWKRRKEAAPETAPLFLPPHVPPQTQFLSVSLVALLCVVQVIAALFPNLQHPNPFISSVHYPLARCICVYVYMCIDKPYRYKLHPVYT